MTPNSKDIIILGTGSSCIYCDFKSEVWGVNGAYTIKQAMPEKYRDRFRIDKLFLTDVMFSDAGVMNFDIKGMNALIHEEKCELISMHRMTLGKYALDAKPYPFTRIKHKFGTDYFTDTITYMIAYALDQATVLTKNKTGVIRLELRYPLSLRFFGVDMATSHEYRVSKGGVEYWIGIARGLGCDILIAKGSSIMAHPRGYPYGWAPKVNVKQYDPFGLMSGKKPPTEEELYDLSTQGVSDATYPTTV